MTELTDEIQLRLKAPIVALERLAEGKHLPKVFSVAALEELKIANQLLERLHDKEGVN